MGAHFSRFFTHEDVERGRPAELLRLAAARGRVEEEGWRVRKDGSRFWANGMLTAIRDSTGQVTDTPRSRATLPTASARRRR